MALQRAVLALAFLAAPAWACLHLPADYEGSIAQSSQGGIVFWNEGHEVLVLKNDFQISAGAALPASLAWVIPVPNEPAGYGVEDPVLFKDLFQFWELDSNRYRDRTGKVVSEALSTRGAPTDNAPDAQKESEGGIELLEARRVGEYEIQPIKTKGPASGAALNAWLSDNGFATVPAENMAYYVERDWVWLAVKVNPAEGQSALSARGEIRPLWISFASERIVYPLKFSSHQGTFDVVLWVVTDEPLPALRLEGFRSHVNRASDSSPFGFGGEGRWFPLLKELDAIQRRAAEGGFVPLRNEEGKKVPHVTQLQARIQGADMADWERDFELQPGD